MNVLKINDDDDDDDFLVISSVPSFNPCKRANREINHNSSKEKCFKMDVRSRLDIMKSVFTEQQSPKLNDFSGSLMADKSNKLICYMVGNEQFIGE